AVAVGGAAAVVHEAGPAADPAAELRVGGADAGVDHVGVHVAGRRVVGVGAAQRPVVLVDAVEAPGGALLGGHRPHLAVLLDVAHARVGRHRLRRLRAHADGAAVQGRAVQIEDAAARAHGQVEGHLVGAQPGAHALCRLVVQHHDVLAGYGPRAGGHVDAGVLLGEGGGG